MSNNISPYTDEENIYLKNGFQNVFVFEVSHESLDRTVIGDKGPGARVHLERAMVLGGRLGGHLVLGHVDGTGQVTSVERDGNALRIAVKAPAAVARFLVPKGSITITL